MQIKSFLKIESLNLANVLEEREVELRFIDSVVAIEETFKTRSRAAGAQIKEASGIFSEVAGKKLTDQRHKVLGPKAGKF